MPTGFDGIVGNIGQFVIAPSHRSAFLDTDYPALLADEELPDLAQTLLIGSDFEGFVANGNGADDPVVEHALAALTADDLSDIMFTSGTTGAPKGALGTHDRVVPMFRHWVDVMGLGEGERYLIINPFFHSFGFKAGWVAALIAGAATGAASVPPELIRRMRSELGLVDTVTAYGMTECSTITACRRGDDAELIATSVGKVIPGLDLKIAGKDGAELPCGETGEIHVRGYGVMKGYLDDPEATAEAIDADGWLHTGDVGVMDEVGYVRITDRIKDMYISGGFNCYPAEIEKLLADNGEVGMVAVVGVPDERMGEVGKAFVVQRPGTKPTAQSITAWSRDNMANYKVPRQVEIVEALPLNASGKVLKTELRKT